MLDVRVRLAEGCADDPFLLWDSVWRPNDGAADWRLADAGEKLNRGGLTARQALATAVMLSLFTDRRLPVDHPLAYLADGDPRGWWGNAVDVRDDLGEAELGSLLWLLERAPLTVRDQSIARWAEAFAIEALTPMQRQGAFARMEVEAETDEQLGMLALSVKLYAADGAATFDHKFDVLWRQLAR